MTTGKCIWCDERVDAGQSDPRHTSNEPIHRECFVRMVTGSLGHHMRRCQCVVKDGTAVEDPPGMSTREAAKLANLYLARLTALNDEFARLFPEVN